MQEKQARVKNELLSKMCVMCISLAYIIPLCVIVCVLGLVPSVSDFTHNTHSPCCHSPLAHSDTRFSFTYTLSHNQIASPIQLF